jgi:hypothetical protein
MAPTRSRCASPPPSAADATHAAYIRCLLQGELRALAVPPQMVISADRALRTQEKRTQSAHGGRLGDYLCAHQLITEDDLASTLVEQQRRIAQGQPIALGDLLVEKGRLTAHQLVTVLMLQQLDRQQNLATDTPSPLGELLLRAGLISADQLHAALTIQTTARQQGDTIRLGQVLLEMGVLSRQNLASTLVHQRHTRRR